MQLKGKTQRLCTTLPFGVLFTVSSKVLFLWLISRLVCPHIQITLFAHQQGSPGVREIPKRCSPVVSVRDSWLKKCNLTTIPLHFTFCRQIFQTQNPSTSRSRVKGTEYGVAHIVNNRKWGFGEKETHIWLETAVIRKSNWWLRTEGYVLHWLDRRYCHTLVTKMVLIRCILLKT